MFTKLNLLSKLKHSMFVKNTAKLAGSEVFAQALALGALPILTKLYSPEEFGLYALFVAIASLLTTIGCARYEIAIPAANNHDEAWKLTILCYFLSSLTSVLGLMILILLPKSLFGPLSALCLLTPLAALINSFSAATRYWLARTGRFHAIASSRVTYSFTLVGLQLSLWYLMNSTTALISGFLLASLTQLSVMLPAAILTSQELSDPESDLKPRSDILELRRVLLLYKRYPQFLLLAHSLNTLASHLPVLLTTTFFGSRVAGYFSLAIRIMETPSVLVGRALQQVFYPEAAKLFRETGSCRTLLINTVKILFFLGFIGFGFVAFAAPYLVALIFDSNWLPVAYILQVVALPYIVQFVDSPISCILFIREKQSIELLWQISLVVFISLGLYIGELSGDWTWGVYGYGVAVAVGFGINLILSYNYAKKSPGKNVSYFPTSGGDDKLTQASNS